MLKLDRWSHRYPLGKFPLMLSSLQLAPSGYRVRFLPELVVTLSRGPLLIGHACTAANLCRLALPASHPWPFQVHKHMKFKSHSGETFPSMLLSLSLSHFHGVLPQPFNSTLSSELYSTKLKPSTVPARCTLEGLLLLLGILPMFVLSPLAFLRHLLYFSSIFFSKLKKTRVYSSPSLSMSVILVWLNSFFFLLLFSCNFFHPYAPPYQTNIL